MADVVAEGETISASLLTTDLISITSFIPVLAFAFNPFTLQSSITGVTPNRLLRDLIFQYQPPAYDFHHLFWSCFHESLYGAADGGELARSIVVFLPPNVDKLSRLCDAFSTLESAKGNVAQAGDVNRACQVRFNASFNLPLIYRKTHCCAALLEGSQAYRHGSRGKDGVLVGMLAVLARA